MIFFNVGNREFMHSNVLTYDSSKFFFPNSNYLQMTVSNNIGEPNLVEIKSVVFNPPATIVFWTDNSKTVVKAENEASVTSSERSDAARSAVNKVSSTKCFTHFRVRVSTNFRIRQGGYFQ